jgi:hypothetical protein
VKAIPSNLANAAEHIAIIGFAITDITFSNSGGAISVGVAVQLVIVSPLLTKVMSLIAEPIVAIWSTAFARLGASELNCYCNG